MNSYKTKNRNYSVYAILSGISFFLIIMSIAGAFNFLPIFQIFTVTLNNPVNSLKSNFSDLQNKFSQNENLAKDNIDLRKQVIILQSELSKEQDEKKELDSLRNLNKVTSFKKENVQTHTISIVFSDKIPVSMTIDKGTKDGIKVGSAVINDTGSLIGIIDSAQLYTSTVKPYYLYEEIKFPIRSSSTSTALVQGIKNGQVIGVNLNQDGSVNVNDAFFSSGLSDKLPEGIYIGKVSSLDNEDKKLFYLNTDILNTDILYVFL